jgi:hypothetical protein
VQNQVGGILKLDPVTGAELSICAPLGTPPAGWPRGVAVAPGGIRVDVVHQFGLGALAYARDAGAGSCSFGNTGGSTSPLEGIAFGADGQAYGGALGALLDSTADGSIVEYGGSGGTGAPPMGIVASGGLLRNVFDLVGDPSGPLYAVDVDDAGFPGPATSGRVVRIDPTSGAQTLVTEGGHLVHPTAVDMEASGMLVVADQSSASLVRVDPVSGAQTLLAQYGLLVAPFGLAIEPSGTAVVLDQGNQVVRVDLVTGAQSPVATIATNPGAIDVALARACSNGLDDDGDGSSDSADGGCESPLDASEREECADGFDNDGDGLVDAAADPGCAGATDLSEDSPTMPCDDGADNDGDGLVDFRTSGGDPGCRTASSFRENPQCDDDLDNDGDTRIDWNGPGAADPQCVGRPWGEQEKLNRCGLGFELAPLLVALLAWRSRRSPRDGASIRPSQSG